MRRFGGLFGGGLLRIILKETIRSFATFRDFSLLSTDKVYSSLAKNKRIFCRMCGLTRSHGRGAQTEDFEHFEAITAS